MQFSTHWPMRPYTNQPRQPDQRPRRAPMPRAGEPGRRGLVDVLTCGGSKGQQAAGSGVPKWVARGAQPVTSPAGGPAAVVFASDAQIVRRLNDEALWPPKVTSGLVAVLSRYCYALMLREVSKTYAVDGAADAIERMLAPMRQMANVEQMRTLQVLMANVFIVDETPRDSVKDELREKHDPAR